MANLKNRVVVFGVLPALYLVFVICGFHWCLFDPGWGSSRRVLNVDDALECNFLLCSWWCKIGHKNEFFFQCLAAQYTVKESDSPTLYFACNIVGHCLQGQKVAINIPAVRSPASFLFSPLYPLRNPLLFPSHMIRCVGCYSVRFSCSLWKFWLKLQVTKGTVHIWGTN